VPGQTVELADVLNAAMDARLQGVFTAMPGTVQSYDATKQAADVQPQVKTGYISEGGDRAVERVPVVPHVPVVFPGSGKFSITWPLQPGDTGLLIFCNCSIDRWLAVGGEVDPADDRRHCIADAVFIPGLRPFSSPVTPTPATDAMVLSGDDIRIGDASATPLAFNADLAQLVSILGGVTPGPGSGDAAIAALQSYLGTHLGFPAGTLKAKGT
jgi:hypothetical protein